ncbi:MAG: hypothetical protein ACXVCP_11520 [Bdellovibrio sp.]
MSDIWFKRKKYGWGWTPANAKGWLVIIFYAILASLLSFIAPMSIVWFLISILILTMGLIWLCYKKGKKPKWSWGSDKDF